jgi:quinoprotein glucose dehydrogenase
MALLPCLTCAVGPAYAAGDPFGWHHSPATQITPGNVARLTPAWTHRNGDMAAEQGAPSSVSAQSTPILLPPEAGEHLVYCTPFNRVIALDPRSGMERWVYDPQVPRSSERPYRCRGVATLVPQADVARPAGIASTPSP